MQQVTNDAISAARKMISPVHVHPTENSTSTVLMRRSVTYLQARTQRFSQPEASGAAETARGDDGSSQREQQRWQRGAALFTHR